MLGAVTGAALALVLYGVYEVTSPHLTAWLTVPHPAAGEPPPTDTNFSGKSDREEHLAQRAREIVELFGERRKNEEDALAPRDALISEEPAPPPPPSPLPPPPPPTPSASIEEPQKPVSPPETATPVPPIARSEAPTLPRSGIGTWLAMFLSLLAAVGVRFRKRLYAEITSL